MSFDDIVRKRIWNIAPETPFPLKMLRRRQRPRPALALALCRRTPVCCCGLQTLPAESQAAPAATEVHIWFFVVSLLLLLILLEIQTSVLAQGHIEILQAKSSLGTSLLTTRTNVWTPGPACGSVIFILYEMDLGFLLVIF